MYSLAIKQFFCGSTVLEEKVFFSENPLRNQLFVDAIMAEMVESSN